MERYQKIILVLGFIIIIGLLFGLDPYTAGIGAIILFAIFMSFTIYNTSKRFPKMPELKAFLSDNAKSVIIKNTGEARAVSIRVAIVPLDIEFEVPPLAPEEAYTIALPRMIDEAKAAMTYDDERGRTFTHSSPLSALGEGEEDFFKPAFPMFGWK